METINVTGNNRLLNDLRKELGLQSDQALAQTLSMPPSFISKVRTGKNPIGPSGIIRIHKLTSWSIEKIESYLEVNHG